MTSKFSWAHDEVDVVNEVDKVSKLEDCEIDKMDWHTVSYKKNKLHVLKKNNKIKLHYKKQQTNIRKEINCKYETQEAGSCPYGDQCFFKHP